MATLCLNLSSNAQEPLKPPALKNQGVIGKIISAFTGESLPGAVIKVNAQNYTTVSSDKGEFILTLSNGTYNLSISHLGYKNKSISIQVPFKESLVIALDNDDKNLQEVEINAGYYTVKDKERTGAISRVTAETIGKQPVSNPLAALIGRMPGVNIEQQSGINGGGFKVEIRGQNSLRTTSADNGNRPLYIIDGVPYPSSPITNSNLSVEGLSAFSSPLNYINPADIESIEVLKDADATAIYGSRGANGVILISTKKAKSGQHTIDMNVYHGVSEISRRVELLNTQQYLEMRREAFKNDNTSPGPTDYDVNGTWDQNRYTDWQEVLIGGKAKNTSLQAAINGGNELTQFTFRGNYSRNTTVTPGNFVDHKGAGALSVNHTSANHKFKASFSASYSIDRNKLGLFDVSKYISLPPNAPPLYDEKGKLNWGLNSSGSPTWTNPIASIYQPYNSKANGFITSALLDYELVKGLFLKSSFGYTNIGLNENLITPISSQAPSPSAVTGTNLSAFNNIETWIIEPLLNYKRKIGPGTIDLVLGATFQKDDQRSERISASGYLSDLYLDNVSVAPSRLGSASSSQYRYNAIFGRVNYNLNSRYIVNLTGRRDGSSRFGPDQQFGNFGAIGLAWIFSNESWLAEKLPMLSYGKLRGSYGITGNDQIPNYGYLETYKATTQPYQGENGLIPSRIANPDFSWETSRKAELALDLGFINDKILLALSHYGNRSSNQLVGYTLPDITGFPSIQYNLPATIQNTGWEFELNTTNIKTTTFSWKSSLNFSVPKNKLVSYPNIEGSSYVYMYTVGASMFRPKAYHYLGVDAQTGVYMFEDVDGNGNDTDETDRKLASRSLTSHWYGGFQNSITFKGLQLDFFFQFVNKTSRYSSTFPTPGALYNQPIEVMDRWQKPGDIANYQMFTQDFGLAGNKDYYLVSSDRFRNSSFVRLKNLSLSWNAPSQWIHQAKIKSLRLYLQGQNLITLTKYPGDPEVGASGALPSLRTVTLGMQISF